MLATGLAWSSNTFQSPKVFHDGLSNDGYGNGRSHRPPAQRASLNAGDFAYQQKTLGKQTTTAALELDILVVKIRLVGRFVLQV